MSRPIKFRAWVEEEKWDYYAYNIQKRADMAEWFGHPTIHIEQYTGAKDKNGKEIYEGDIVKISAYSRVFQVVYREWDCSFVYENDEDEVIVSIFKDFPNAYEVIGNIHENKKLLGGEE